MEYGHSTGYDRSIHRDFAAAYGESPRDWFATDKFAATESSDLMEEYPPAATNENHYLQKHHQQQQNSTQPQTLVIDNNGEIQICNNIEREHMFDKVVTPSDVGKLNRLVIPKQHAEKYFPLDSSSNEKGLLLDFEDLTGKAWRFRYSYWNSSQSYVMTKGWSRFVKEKKLDAGDIVSFQRGVIDKHRFFIDWKRRPITHQVDMSQFHSQFYRSTGGILPSWSPFMFRPPANRVHPGINFQIHQSPSNHYYSGYGNANYVGQVVSNNASVVYLTNPERIGMVQRMGEGGGGVGERIIPADQGKKRLGSGVAKKLRLFGVNMECPISTDTSTSVELEMLSTSNSITLNSPTAHHLITDQYPSRMYYNGAPISNKGKKSMSLDLEI